MEGQQHWYASEINLNNQVIADLGANVGRLSQFFWDIGADTNTVVSIEPLPQNIKRIRKRITRSKAGNWRVEAVVVSDRAGECVIRSFHSTRQGWNSMVIGADADEAASGKVKDIVVECRTLSELVPDATVVKVDIEGHEYAVFDEALDKLPRVHTWAMELHMVDGRPLGQVIGQFMQNGYTLIAATQGTGGHWGSVNIDAQLQWDSIPAMHRLADGREFKMLHVIARRRL
ncbi:MAG TPA: FkbM family methyltransferase [Gammaproteobacteria bacterium]|nr:FkbM family methyltransferase [Gammaproteobacteria bacterium]